MNDFSKEEREILLNLAKDSIKHGLKHNKPLPIKLSEYSKHLIEFKASFVTLELDGELRGCIGSLEAYQPLVSDVVQNAYAAAFQDPRFLRVTENEYPKLSIHISILSKPEPIDFISEEDLISKLRPGIDGLIIIEFGQRGTFLPTVWESLKDAKTFLQHLKIKTGLPMDYWSDTIRVERYTTETI